MYCEDLICITRFLMQDCRQIQCDLREVLIVHGVLIHSSSSVCNKVISYLGWIIF
jgi:hypothetical protein